MGGKATIEKLLQKERQESHLEVASKCAKEMDHVLRAHLVRDSKRNRALNEGSVLGETEGDEGRVLQVRECRRAKNEKEKKKKS